LRGLIRVLAASWLAPAVAVALVVVRLFRAAVT
jgi:hypothetical protein